MHVLRDLGLFTNKEWALLRKASERSWVQKYGVDSLYQDLSTEDKLEEGIAIAYEKWARTSSGASEEN